MRARRHCVASLRHVPNAVTYGECRCRYRVATSLNNFENHRTTQTHENRLIVKLFIFFFVDCFLRPPTLGRC